MLSEYPALGSGVFAALGLTAAFALGWTPLVIAISGGIFALVAVGSTEGAAMFPEDGGLAALVRHAFNDLGSFLAGWAMLLALAAVTAVAALFAAHYLSPFWSGLASAPWDTVTAVVIVAALAASHVLRLRGPVVAGIFAGALTIATQVLVALLGLAFVFQPHLLRAGVRLSSGVSFGHIMVALGVGAIAFTDLDAVAGMASRSTNASRDLQAAVPRLMATAVPLAVALALVAAMAMPVTRTPNGSATTTLAQAPPHGYAAYPMFGIVARFSPHVFAVGLRFAVGLVIAAALIMVAGTAMGVAVRLSSWLAEHVQLPARVAAPDVRYGSPVTGIVAFAAVVAGALVVFGGGAGAGSLAALFGYGAMLSLTAGQSAVIAMRWRDPERHRPFRVPGGLELAGAELPVLTALAAAATLTVWIGLLAFDHTPALVGSLWMAVGVAGYALYRRRNGMTLTQRRVRPAPAAHGRPRVEVEFHTTLVAVDVRQPAGVAEAVEVAARLAAERRAVVVLVELAEIPLGEEMDVELDDLDADAELVTEQAQSVCAQYGIRLITTLLRTRDPVAAILSEADRRDSGVIIVSTAGLRRRDGLIPRLLAQAPQRVMLIQPRKAVV